ncbi:MAG: hypothetical protein BA863_01005 [Desulfovibrio sp. S3730MH75]|nr:MAG: hypothetical protein BA863_01005 [Desulfovibrio sp. S3730MH75]
MPEKQTVKPVVTSLNLNLGETEVKLSLSEAKQVYEALKEFFDSKPVFCPPQFRPAEGEGIIKVPRNPWKREIDPYRLYERTANEVALKILERGSVFLREAK